MTILCEPDQRLAARLTRELRGRVLTVTSLPEVAMALVREPAESVVVIGAGVELAPALSLSIRLRAERPATRVILLRDAIDAVLTDEAAAAGVHEVVRADRPELLTRALAQARTTGPDPDALVPAADAPERVPHGRVITVFSTKGGCGKTTLATNLAVALHVAPTRTVCLLDLDLAFGDVAISMALTPRRTLVDAVEAGGALAEHIDEILTEYHPGLDCILAPVEPGDAERIPAALIRQLLDALVARYDYILIDTPAQFSEHVLAALDASDHHVLVATPEVPALKNLRLTLDLLDLLGYRRDTRAIVLNRSDARGGLSARDAEHAVSSPITAQVPASHDVPASINRGVPIVEGLPDHAVSRAIAQFAAQRLSCDPVATGRATGRRGLKLRKRSA